MRSFFLLSCTCSVVVILFRFSASSGSSSPWAFHLIILAQNNSYIKRIVSLKLIMNLLRKLIECSNWRSFMTQITFPATSFVPNTHHYHGHRHHHHFSHPPQEIHTRHSHHLQPDEKNLFYCEDPTIFHLLIFARLFWLWLLLHDFNDNSDWQQRQVAQRATIVTWVQCAKVKSHFKKHVLVTRNKLAWRHHFPIITLWNIFQTLKGH